MKDARSFNQKYPDTKISKLVSDKLEGVIVTESIVKDLLENKVCFKMAHYEKASELLNITVDELLSEVESAYDNPEVLEFKEKVTKLFEEYIYLHDLANA